MTNERSHPTLRRLDLNLLRVFEAVLRHRSIVGASQELSVTSSAVSHALTRLRSALSDRLFVATSKGMEPTMRALELAPHIRAGLQRLEEALDQRPFDPARASRSYRIAGSDHAISKLMPSLLTRVGAVAPNVDFRIFPGNRLDTVRHLDDGRIDLVVSWLGDLPARIRRVTLWPDFECLVVRPGHPLTKGEPSRDDLLRFPHVIVELTGSHKKSDNGYVEDRGVARRVWIERLLLEVRDDGRLTGGRSAVSVPYFGAVVPIVRATDLVGTLPRSYAQAAVERGEVVALPLPYEPLRVDTEAMWHERCDRDPAHRWLIERVLEATATLRAPA